MTTPLSRNERERNIKMADGLSVYRLLQYKFISLAFIISLVFKNSCQDIVGCGGFVKSQVSIDFSKVEIKLYTKQGTLKESSDCAPTNGYYFIPLYDKGEYLLKIEPPAGWYFEPKEVHLNFDGVSDPCSKSNDINFVFKGFAIRGKVISAGSSEGPENIVVNLLSETDKSLVANTTTGKGGYFQFTPVVPDNYVIKVKNDKYKFVKDSIKVKVKEETGELPSDSLVIAGYDITGQVLFNGEPTKGVSFVLFANDEQNKNLKLPDCVKTPLPNYQFKDFLCHVTSNENGVFHMKTLPPGSYKIKPYYSKFDVKPEEINVVVRHGHIVLSDKFLVKGFSVGGRVLTSPGGSGIKNALIYLNGVKVAVSDDDGRYNLDSMEPGTYILSIEADDVRFEGVKVKISPNTPEIENIYPTEFKICGFVNPWLTRDETRMVEIRQTKGKQPIIKAAVDENSGKFCEFLKPGTYALKVIVSDFEKSTGMQYLPLTKEIHVKNGPVPGIEFTQLKGNIRGKVKKLPEVTTSAELTIKLKLKSSLLALKILEKNDLSYSFNEIMPGFYDVEIDNNEWCFQTHVHSISVSSSETIVPDFVQTGFKVRIWSSHKTPAIVRDSDPNGNYKTELVLERGENFICLPRSSLYKLELVGCHGFEKDVYQIDVKDGRLLRLYAVSHEVTGFIRSHSLENDLLVEVAPLNRQAIKLGPLIGEKIGNEFIYRFGFRTGENQILKFTPSSSKLLFQPEFFEYRTINDCSNDAVQFNGERGLIIEGVVNPPLANVKITLKTNPLSSNAEEVVFVTQSDGRYKFGPLRKTTDYELTAEKESYILTGPDKNGVFKAHKLAEINVKVMDNSTKEPLQGVLLSLTGGEKYRKNSMTGEEGQLSFHSLSPGEYFLRPMMKEYKFEPSSQIIQIKEGVTESIELRGRRVSFSAYGTVTSLNGEPEPNVVIEAVGLNTCSNLQEDASSEANGQFRIRGLLPQCEYQIRLKSGPDVNLMVHRLAPQDLIVKTNKGDVRDIQLTVFQLIDQTDVAVHVESTIPEHLKTLKLKLYKDDSPDSPIHIVKLDSLAGGVKQWGSHDAQERFLRAGLLVLLPNIPRDKGVYFIQLESSLNKHTYSYKEPVVHFSADKTYRSLKMSFEPVIKTMDHELSQTNYIVVPLIIFAVLFYNYFNKALPLIQNFLGSLNNQFANAREERNFYSHNSMADNVSIEPVGVTVVKRKPKPRKT